MQKITIYFAVLVTSLLAFNASAQQDSLREKRKHKFVTQAKKNTERLALKPEQKQPFAEISQKYSEKTLALKQTSLSREEKLQEVTKINADRDAEVKLLLTPAQFAIYKEIVDERRQKMKAARDRQIKVE